MTRDTFTANVPKTVIEHPDFSMWLEDLDGSQSIKIVAAISKIESEGLVTSTKNLGEGLYEKKWVSGLRLYFAVIELRGKKTLLLLGSGKGFDQNRSIMRARASLSLYEVCKEKLKRD